MRSLFIWPEAEEELLAAIEWYESKRVGLGIELLAEVEQAFDSARAAPATAPLFEEGLAYRSLVVRRFPYAIVFRASDVAVEVVAVAHAKRRPGYWLSRRPRS